MELVQAVAQSGKQTKYLTTNGKWMTEEELRIEREAPIRQDERTKMRVELEKLRDDFKEEGSQLMNCKRRWTYQDVCLGKATLLNKIIKELR